MIHEKNICVDSKQNNKKFALVFKSGVENVFGLRF